MLTLRYPYVSVEKNGVISYGGSQTWSDSKVMRRCGCGVVGGMDLLIYLSKYHRECRSDVFPDELLWDVIREEEYDKYSKKLSRGYLPLMPPFGMNGLTLVLGLNLCFRRFGMPMRAQWGVRRSELWQSIEKMLSEDIPVILSIGPNFPRVWENNKAALYVKQCDDHPHRAASTHSHFLTVTGIDEDWLQVSSWGRKYYISRGEYEEYVSRYSNGVLSSIVYIDKR